MKNLVKRFPPPVRESFTTCISQEVCTMFFFEFVTTGKRCSIHGKKEGMQDVMLVEYHTHWQSSGCVEKKHSFGHTFSSTYPSMYGTLAKLYIVEEKKENHTHYTTLSQFSRLGTQVSYSSCVYVFVL